MKTFWLLSLVFCFAASCTNGRKKIEQNAESPNTAPTPKVTGVSLEMPGNKIGQERVDELQSVNAQWVAMIPYGYTEKDDAKVNFHYGSRWWGESLNGTKDLIKMAKKTGLKIMLKPHVWVVGQGWPGDFDLKKEADWKVWEKTYRKYIIACAHIADSMAVDLFCIGTEYRKAVVKRSEFWKEIIKEIKTIYSGPLTYAANWDNYQKVNFWDQLDFIGIDAYFPLSSDANPSLDELKTNWEPVQNKLSKFSEKQNKKILFTEYGYKSIEYTNSGFWNYKEDTIKTSMSTQANAYSALFETVWQNEWMMGGFFWKWHMYTPKVNGPENRRYTPQGKTAMDVITKWYKQ